MVQFGVDYFPRTRGVSTLALLPEVVEKMAAFGAPGHDSNVVPLTGTR